MISVRFQGKPFTITVIQAYAPTSNTEEAEVEQFDEDLQDLLELPLPKRCPFYLPSILSFEIVDQAHFLDLIPLIS